jgi:vacuolar iron transporter family protein
MGASELLSDESTPLTAANRGSLVVAADNGVASSEARIAYHQDDVEASRRFHDLKAATEEGHQSGGGLLKPIIFGGLDGILTSFAIVAGAAGGNLSPQVVLILGFSNILADALSMGVGEFLSSKATNEWILSERCREEWELENYPEGEIKEMVDIYVSKGMTQDDAEKCIAIMSKYKDFFVDLMMQQELELQVPEDDHVQESVKEGFIMFASFATFGALPLLGYVIIPTFFPHLDQGSLFLSACIVTGVVLFFMGSIKSWFSAQNWFRSGMETLMLGGTCATVAFTVGQIVNNRLGGGE